MKRFITASLAALILTAALLSAACVSIAPVYGKWKVFAINAKTPDQYIPEHPDWRSVIAPALPEGEENWSAEDDEFILLDFGYDDAAVLTVFGRQYECTWKQAGDDVFIFLSEAEVLQLYCLRQTAKLGITLDCGENGMIEIVFTRA